MSYSRTELNSLHHRLDACNYLTVAQIYLQSNFLLELPLSSTDIKPRLLGHWGTCYGINLIYSYLKTHFKNDPNFHFVLGPGHGFPALQANLYLDRELEQIDNKATLNLAGLSYLCRNFSWPGGFPSHSSPLTPGVICEGGELGYALATAYGFGLNHPEKTIAVLLGDGELETATALASLNLHRLLGGKSNAKILPILHLNGYKISGPTIYARKSERELNQLIRGFGFDPIELDDKSPEPISQALSDQTLQPFFILRTDKGATGPDFLGDQKISGNYLSHQVPLKNAKTDSSELALLESWLKSYNFNQIFHPEQGFIL